MSLFRDEQEGVSSARVLSWGWLAFTAWYVIAVPAATAGVLSLVGTIALALISWAAGPRIAQYVMPAAGRVFSSLKDAVSGRRDEEEGIERTP